jgi:hypothetical protein
MKIYAKVGDSQQIVIADGITYSPQEGEILMQSERPTDGEYVAKADGTWGVYEPTTEERLAQLDSDYQLQKQELITQYTDDMLHGDSESMESDKQAMVDLDTWYDEEYAKIEGSED